MLFVQACAPWSQDLCHAAAVMLHRCCHIFLLPVGPVLLGTTTSHMHKIRTLCNAWYNYVSLGTITSCTHKIHTLSARHLPQSCHPALRQTAQAASALIKLSIWTRLQTEQDQLSMAPKGSMGTDNSTDELCGLHSVCVCCSSNRHKVT